MFGLSLPSELGGAELPLRATVEIYEALARMDPATAWLAWNGNTGFAAALLDEVGARTVWPGDFHPLVVNGTQPTGEATAVTGGFRLSGRWSIVSGVDSADWAALFAFSHDGILACFAPRDDLVILDTWHTSGMRATGSNAVVVEDVLVPTDLAVNPLAPSRIDRPLYRIPAFSLVSSGIGGIALGVAQAALDAVIELAQTKATDAGLLADRSHAHAAVGHLQTAVDAARHLLYARIEQVQAAAEACRTITEDDRSALRAAMSHAAGVAREVLNSAYELAGTSALYSGSPIERIFRDGMVAMQHGVLSRSLFELRGRMLFGRPAGTPMF